MSADRESVIHNVMSQMANVQQKSQAFVERVTKKETLTQNQIMLLVQLRLIGRLSITDVAERFIVTPGAASSMCDKLEEQELIERVRTKEDRRVVYIQLTAQGEERILHMFGGFTAEELTKLSDVLQQIDALMAEIII
jgi:MarR family transcriptional regulator, organic hydroperoxide resistance regulator